VPTGLGKRAGVRKGTAGTSGWNRPQHCIQAASLEAKHTTMEVEGAKNDRKGDTRERRVLTLGREPLKAARRRGHMKNLEAETRSGQPGRRRTAA